MNRRSFLLSGALVATAGGAAVGLTRWGRIRTMAAAIRAEFSDFADLGDAPEQYAAAFIDLHGGWAVGRDVNLNFLLSTDFFHTGEDPFRPLKFVAIYDPLANPCMIPVPWREE